MPRTGQPAVRHVAAVERALAVLDALADGAPELGTNEIARRTGINASTVSRLLATLVNAGMVEHVPSSGRYRLGLRLLQLGNAVLGRLDLREVARPHLHELAIETGETATLSAPGRARRDDGRLRAERVVRAERRAGRAAERRARDGDGQGACTRSAVRSSRTARSRSYTPRTITDRRKLAAELERVRRQGYAEAVGEREPHLNAIAAPVFSARDELAAIIGVQGPSSRFGRDAMRSALDPLLTHAHAVSEAIGWTEEDE